MIVEQPLFYKFSKTINLAEVAVITAAQLSDVGFADKEILRLASLDDADENAISFIDNKKYLDKLTNTKTGAIFCTAEFLDQIPSGTCALVCERPYLSFCKLINFLYKDSILQLEDAAIKSIASEKSFISSRAMVHPTARFENKVVVEDGAYIGENAYIGSGTVIRTGAIVAANTTIGRNCFIGYNTAIQFAMIGDGVIIHPGAKIGQDGFGYIICDNGIEKIPQIGRVIIQDNVEIGSNTTIDRGSLSDTIIGEGTKIDNLVQIGHNVVIGRYCVIAAHSGIAGSVSIGDMTVLGGRVGIKDHVKIGSRVQIVAASGIMNDIGDGEKWGGVPARPVKQWFREVAALRNMVNVNK